MTINTDLKNRTIDHSAMVRMYEDGVHKSIDKTMNAHAKRMTVLLKKGDFQAVRKLELRKR